jgi:nucleotide-binding universal stress UspA family protein
MYRSILVPLDGRWYGEHALPVARAIAKRFGAALHLVHVQTAAVVPAAIESLPYVGTHVNLGPREAEHGYLEGLSRRLSEEGLRVSTEVVQGPIAEALERYAVERGAELVVACTHCHEGLSRLWHRGLGEKILHDVRIPILLIRSDDSEPDLAAERRVRHVLVPLDGSVFAEEILDGAIPLAHAFGARVTLLRVVRPMTTVGYSLLGQDAHVNHFLLDDQQREATAYLVRIAERLRAAGMEVRTRVVVHEEPADAIIDSTRPELEEPPVDLIAMSTHCRGPLARLVISSVTDRVLHHSPVPLLMHRPAAQAAGEPEARELIGA